MWFQGKWPDKCKAAKYSIAWVDFFPAVVAIAVWGESLKGKRIIVRSDNAAVVAILNKKTSKCPAIKKLLRVFVLQCLKYNVKNNIALSRYLGFRGTDFRKQRPTQSSREYLFLNFFGTSRAGSASLNRGISCKNHSHNISAWCQ